MSRRYVIRTYMEPDESDVPFGLPIQVTMEMTGGWVYRCMAEAIARKSITDPGCPPGQRVRYTFRQISEMTATPPATETRT